MYVARRLECRPITLCSEACSRTRSWCEQFKNFRRMQVRFGRVLNEEVSRVGLSVTGVTSPPLRGMMVVGSATSKASVSRRLRRPSLLYVQTYLQYSRGVLDNDRNIFLRAFTDALDEQNTALGQKE